MSSRVRHRPSPPSRAKRNIRWAALALVAMSLAPAGSPDGAAPGDDPTLAAETTPSDELPFIADGGDLDLALDLGAGSMPLE